MRATSPRSEHDDLHERIDGRRLRGERTRGRVLDALLALVEEGELRPTAQDVARRAGVALRTVYHHFEDVDALRGTALDLQLNRHRELLIAPEPHRPRSERITYVATQCGRLFEAITPIRLATQFDTKGEAERTEGIRVARAFRRAFVEESFAPELDGVSVGRRDLLDALDAVTSWHSWFFLREALFRSVAASVDIMELQIRSLLDLAERSKDAALHR